MDTEGFVSRGRGGIRIAQASLIELTKEEKEFVLMNSKTRIIKPSNKESKVIVFSKLNKNFREKVLSNPSLILLSIQLLLRKYGINSKMYPLCVYISSNGIASISWHLAILGFDETNKFYDLCGNYISINYKRNNIKEILINVIKIDNRVKFWNITEEGMKILEVTCENKEKWDYLLK